MSEVASGLAAGIPLALKTSLNKINQVYWNDKCSGAVLELLVFEQFIIRKFFIKILANIVRVY